MLIGSGGGQFATIQADVQSLQFQILYFDTTTGVNGVPTSWPGGSGTPTAPYLMICFKPDYTMLLAGQLDASLKAWLSQAPPGTMVTPWQEANYAANFPGTPAQFNAMSLYLRNLVRSMGYPIYVGQKYSTFTIFQNGQDLTPFVQPGMDWYGLDGYAAKWTVNPGGIPTAEDVFEGARLAITSVYPQARVGITETNADSSTEISPISRADWFNMCYAYACRKNMFALTYYGAPGSNNDYTTDPIGQGLFGSICRLEAQRGNYPWP